MTALTENEIFDCLITNARAAKDIVIEALRVANAALRARVTELEGRLRKHGWEDV